MDNKSESIKESPDQEMLDLDELIEKQLEEPSEVLSEESSVKEVCEAAQNPAIDAQETKSVQNEDEVI